MNTVEQQEKKVLQNVKKQYKTLADQKSKAIFMELLDWGITQEKKHLRNLLTLSTFQVFDGTNQTREKLNELSKIYTTLLLYGAGKRASLYLENFDFSLFEKVILCDKNYQSIESLQGYPVISPEDAFLNYGKTALFANGTAMPWDEILDIFHNGQVENIYPGSFSDFEVKYFDDFFLLEEIEVLIDGSGFHGAPASYFLTIAKKHESIYLLPLEQEEFPQELLAQSGVIQKNALDTLAQILVQEKEKKNFLIKLSTEHLPLLKSSGSEIRRQKPQLALEISQDIETLVELLDFLSSLVPEYEFYLRHYTELRLETVLYAVIP